MLASLFSKIQIEEKLCKLPLVTKFYEFSVKAAWISNNNAFELRVEKIMNRYGTIAPFQGGQIVFLSGTFRGIHKTPRRKNRR